ncbi:KTSC domain-containing protein [Citrobacter freundii]|nr:KTSC domain-containing protein [Citrobacter europaeus]MBJ8823586.1 KTSC domain-containing protein [Citrobacter freundii]MDT7086249.1 KTSC domain-containing protein [Citrobacter europaeus]
MLRQPVASSNLQSVGYDVSNRILEIAFHGGGIYQYRVVPLTTYQSLMAAPSKGSYFARHIRNVFPTIRVG